MIQEISNWQSTVRELLSEASNCVLAQNITEANALFEQAITIDGIQFLPEFKKLADLLLKNHYITEAKITYEKIINNFSNEIHGYLGLGQIAEREKDWQLAYNIWQDIQIKFPEEINGWNGQVNSLLQLQRWGEATKISEEMIEKFPDKIHGYHRLANIADKQQDWQLSLLRWQQVHEKFPNDFWGVYGQANTFLNLNKLAEAEKFYQLTLDKFPERIEGYQGIARIAEKNQDWQSALNIWQDIRIKFPELINGWNGQANSLLQLQRWDEATKISEEMIEKFPDKIHGYHRLANIADKQQDWQLSLLRWQQVHEKFPDDFWGICAQANTLLSLNNWQAAEELYKKVIEKFPDQHNGLEGLTEIARISGKLELALEYAEKLKEKFPHLQSGYWETEQILIKMGRFQEATEAFLSRPVEMNLLPKKVKSDDFTNDLALLSLLKMGNDDTFINDRINTIPLLEPEGLQAFDEYLDGTKVFLEYGCGGSTIYAAKQGVSNIISIDTDIQWIQAVQQNITSFPCQTYIHHCNIGNTKSWGYPITDELINNFHEYAILPWNYAKDHSLIPELVLIDGRFRVACFLYSLLIAQPSTKILFDDYTNRTYYHIVEKFCKIFETRGRMAIFIVEKNFSIAEVVHLFAKYSIIKE